VIEIPLERLSVELLEALMEEFILREGTDYGDCELSLAGKKSRLERQLRGGDVVITFDPTTENCTLLTRAQLRRALAEQAAAEVAEPEQEYLASGEPWHDPDWPQR
jgi:uncharacterized protein YheU (UPF0270 family)